MALRRGGVYPEFSFRLPGRAKMKLRTALIPATLAAVLWMAPQAPAQEAEGAPGSFLNGYSSRLYGESLDAAEAFAAARTAEAPADQQAQMALGVARFGKAVQGLAQDLYRHGLTTPEFGLLPFFRLPVPANPAPERLTNDGARQIMIDFVARMAEADAAFAGVADPEVGLPLRPVLVRLDLDGDGVASEAESFAAIFGVYHPRGTPAEARIDFDASDAPWFQGYTHLLSAIAEAWLAHDWHEGFEASFHALFPESGLPGAKLNDLPRARQAEIEAAQAQGYDSATWSGSLISDAAIADAVAFFHLIHWPVTEPERLRASREHLKAMITLSRETWRRIMAETDRGQEWIPSPAQSLAQGDTRPAPVTGEVIDGWMQFLDHFEAVLDGKLLLPHWRLAQGVNLRRVFEEPRVFDILLWIQGSAALPYLEDGPVAGTETWNPIFQLMGGEFMTYFVWFN